MQNIEDSDQIVQKDPISKVTRFLEPEKIQERFYVRILRRKP